MTKILILGKYIVFIREFRFMKKLFGVGQPFELQRAGFLDGIKWIILKKIIIKWYNDREKKKNSVWMT